MIGWRDKVRELLYGARKFIAVHTKMGGFVSDATPFDSRLNIYDRDVHEAAKSLIPSKGEDEFILNAAVNSAVGRKVVPETNMDKLLMEIGALKRENANLKEQLNRG